MTTDQIRKAMGKPLYDEPGFLMYAGKGPDESRYDNDGSVIITFDGGVATHVQAGRSLPVD